jgi:hypothetical protein
MGSSDGPFCIDGLNLDTPIYRIHKQRNYKYRFESV